jgi:hypothetical protein
LVLRPVEVSCRVSTNPDGGVPGAVNHRAGRIGVRARWRRPDAGVDHSSHGDYGDRKTGKGKLQPMVHICQSRFQARIWPVFRLSVSTTAI